MTDVRIVNAEALVVGPDDCLLLIVSAQEFGPPDDLGLSLADELAERLGGLGLRDRCLVIAAEDVKMAVIQNPALGVLPRSTSITPKPVYARYLARQAGETPGPPTEAEIADAISILKDPPPLTPYLILEAERVHVEAS